MARAAKGVAVRGVNIGDIREIQIPLPSLLEQSEIVRRVDELFAYAYALEKRVADARQLADSLEPSILAKAFRGELSDQISEEALAWEKTLAELETASNGLAKKTTAEQGRKSSRMAAEPKAGYDAGPKKRGRPRKTKGI
jgi:type I restriction enzyme, S subunit